MSDISQMHCPNCGGDLIKENEDSLRCRYCGSEFENNSFQRKIRTLQEFLDQTKIEYVNNQRRNLYDAVCSKYISKNEVHQYATEIKKYLPDDFQANFYLEALSGDVKKINDLIRKIDAEENYELLPPIIRFLTASLECEFLLELNLLVERAYKKRDLALYSRYATKISEEAEKVASGIYETFITRDVFIAYSSKDMPIVSKLCEELEDEGFSCFVAARNLRHGVGSVENYDDALKEAMDNCSCFLFVSSVNSRKFDCDAVRKEIPYIRSIDIHNAPPEFRYNYKMIPAKYKRPRIEYRVGSVTRSATNAITNEFFDGYEWVYDTEGVIDRLVRILTATPEDIFSGEPLSGGYIPSAAPVSAPTSVLAPAPVSAPAVTLAPVQPQVCNHIEVIDPAIEATCTAPGRTEGSHCSLCGEILRQSVTIPARGHEFGMWHITKQATCTENGEQERVCHCGEKETKMIPSLGGHKPGEWETVKEPTETETGLKIKKCSVCGEHTAEEKIPKKQAPIAPKMSAQAMTALGDKYYYGKDGVAQNYAKAVELYTKAAEQGYAAAQMNLGIYYQSGKDVPQDNKKAIEWFTKAAEQGYAPAQTNLGYFYENGFGLTKDYAKAVEWYIKAANQNNAIAQNNLGHCYLNGQGIPQDYKKAVEWLTKAAEQDNPAAQTSLGVCYNNARGVLQDSKKAIEWFTKAAEQGFSPAQLNLGICYYRGQGVPKDYKKATEWLTQAAEQGNTNAKKALEKLQKENQNSNFTSANSAASVASPPAILKESKGLAYKVNADGKTCSVSGQGKCRDRDIVIPEKIDGYRVTKIITETRNANYDLISGFDRATKSIVIPDSVTSIEEYAFHDCESLIDITIPNSVTSIGENAFSWCKNLASVSIPDSVTSIGSEAFSDCSRLTRVTLSKSLMSIGDYLFSDCTNLLSITIPNSVTSIGNYAFSDCSNLSKVTFSESVVSIGNYAFCWCRNLDRIDIPDSVKSIGESAFHDCENLVTVTIPNYVTIIQEGMFHNCRKLKNVTLPNSVNTIGNYAFSNCVALTDICYKGQKRQWKNIHLYKEWKKDSHIHNIECIDGTLRHIH